MLSRIRIRSALVAVLTAGPPYPTVAGPLIFDSRLDNLFDQTPDGPLPIVTIYTDDDTSDLQDTASGTGARSRNLELCLEMCVGTFSSRDQGDFNLATTDPEVEALLDILEWQVWNAINDPMNASALAFQRLHMGIRSWTSEAARTADKAHRLAARRIKLALRVKSECVLPIGFTDDVQPEAIAEGTALFDAPYLAELGALLLDRPEMQNVVDMIRYQQGGPLPAARQLTRGFRIVYKADYIDPADPNRLPPGETQGPDGRVEVVFSQTL